MASKSTSSSAPAESGKPTAMPSDNPSASDKKASSRNVNRASRTDVLKAASTAFVPDKPVPCDTSLYPGGSRSLAAIGEQAFFLGFAFAAALAALLWQTLEQPHPLWRLSAFVATLSIFHFLEYETTARYNLPTVRAGSFLLFTNGAAYNIAYALAVVEIVVSNFFPAYQTAFVTEYSIWAGLALTLVGQVVRSTAMCQAGTNFNHMPATKKQEGHVLVTHGIYGWLRHPSYFGFFWWAIGTQLLVGNKACLVGYVFVLWQFFKHRIIGEEKLLVGFFGEDYEKFREKTPTGIPFVR